MIKFNPLDTDALDTTEENAALRVGKRIRKIREEKGLSQEELGKIVGLNADRIQKYENGIRKPKTSLLKQIALALEVNPCALADPAITTAQGSMFMLFELAETFNMKIERTPENHVPGICLTVEFQDKLYRYMEEWCRIYNWRKIQLENATSDEEKEAIMKEYHNWQWTFPYPIVNKDEKAFQMLRLKDQIEELQTIYDQMAESMKSDEEYGQ